jgi:hypothetical protein
VVTEPVICSEIMNDVSLYAAENMTERETTNIIEVDYRKEEKGFGEEIGVISDSDEQVLLCGDDCYDCLIGTQSSMKENFGKKFELVLKAYQRRRTRILKRINKAERNVLLKRLVKNNNGAAEFCQKIRMLYAYDKLWLVAMEMSFDDDVVMEEWLVVNVLMKFSDWNNNWSCKGKIALEKDLRVLNDIHLLKLNRKRKQSRRKSDAGFTQSQRWTLRKMNCWMRRNELCLAEKN